MKKIVFIIISSIISIFLFDPALQGEEKNNEKPVAAVMEFKAHNCPATLSKVAEGTIGSRLFEARIFNLIERGQIDQVMKEMELQQTGCTDSNCLVQMGKMLTASKIITGSIHRIDDYTVIAKVVDVATGKIEANYKQTVLTETDVPEAVSDIAYRIALEYRSEIYYTVSAGALFLYPMGDLGDVIKGGWGTGIDFDVHNLFVKNFTLRASTGYYAFAGREKTVDSVMMVPLAMYAGYRFNISRSFQILPFLGGGYLLNMMKYDSDGIDAFGNYEYSTSAYHDSFFSICAEINYRIFDSLHLLAVPSYRYIFEKNSNSQLFGFQLGVGMSF